jgi:serine/threonine protein kinase
MARGAGDKPFGTLPTEPERRRRQTEPQSSDTIELQPGVVLGKYRIVRRLGAGGMGTVYEAVHVEIGKRVALEVLSGELTAEARSRARFLREAKAASKLVSCSISAIAAA